MKPILPLILLPILASAAFFLKRPSSPSDWLERQGGAHLQHTPITLNDSQGSLDLYALPLPTAELHSKLTTLDPSLAASIFLLPCGAPTAPQTLAFAIQAPPSLSPSWPWHDIPPATELSLSFSATLNHDRTSFVAASSNLPLPSLRSSWTSHLIALGWTPISPAPTTSSLLLFANHHETLALTLLQNPSNTRISILRRSTQH